MPKYPDYPVMRRPEVPVPDTHDVIEQIDVGFGCFADFVMPKEQAKAMSHTIKMMEKWECILDQQLGDKRYQEVKEWIS